MSHFRIVVEREIVRQIEKTLSQFCRCLLFGHQAPKFSREGKSRIGKFKFVRLSLKFVLCL